MWTPEVIAVIGIFLGCFGRAFLPYLRKKRDAAKKQEAFKWDNGFLITAIFSFFVAGITAMLILPAFQMPTGSLLTIFGGGVVYGWAASDMVNNIAK